MTQKSEALSVELASVHDREALVAEVWCGPKLVAELRREDDQVLVQLYAESGDGVWDLPFDELLAALKRARERLGEP